MMTFSIDEKVSYHGFCRALGGTKGARSAVQYVPRRIAEPEGEPTPTELGERPNIIISIYYY
jgi:hypothetical protein